MEGLLNGQPDVGSANLSSLYLTPPLAFNHPVRFFCFWLLYFNYVYDLFCFSFCLTALLLSSAHVVKSSQLNMPHFFFLNPWLYSSLFLFCMKLDIIEHVLYQTSRGWGVIKYASAKHLQLAQSDPSPICWRQRKVCTLAIWAMLGLYEVIWKCSKHHMEMFPHTPVHIGTLNSF